MIEKLIKELGFKENIKGTKIIIDLLENHFNNNSTLPLNKNGYKLMSLKYDKTISTIIKDIQYSIDYVFLNGNNKMLFEIFGLTIDEETGRPTSKQFIMTLIDKMENEKID